jgi:hypothetical protein
MSGPPLADSVPARAAGVAPVDLEPFRRPPVRRPPAQILRPRVLCSISSQGYGEEEGA